METNLKEYDCLLKLMKQCTPKSQRNSTLTCFDVCKQYFAFGWNSGTISILHREPPSKPYWLKLSNGRHSWLSPKTHSYLPTDISLRVATNLIVIVCCICVSSVRQNGAPDQIQLCIYRIPRSPTGSLNIRKSVRKTLTRIHHAPLSASPYVSPDGDLIISGDDRGLIVASKFDGQNYVSYTLAVIPGSAVNLQLNSTFLLITGRAFATSSESEENGGWIVEPAPVSQAQIFLFDMLSRRLFSLDFSEIIPKNLGLSVSCARPAWLAKRAIDNSPLFACSVIRADAPTHNLSTSVPVVAFFAVSETCNVTMHRLVVLDPIPNWSSVPRIPVLPSVISTMRSSRINGDNVFSSAFSVPSYAEKSLHVISHDIILLWYSPSSSGHRYSILSILQLLPDEIETSSDHSVLAKLITYSDQLGLIHSITALRRNPMARKMNLYPDNTRIPSNSSNNTVLDVWIYRETDTYNDAVPILLLSTLPLRISEMATAPFTDLSHLFDDTISMPSRLFATPAPSILGLNMFFDPTYASSHRLTTVQESRSENVFLEPHFEIGTEVSEEFESDVEILEAPLVTRNDTQSTEPGVFAECSHQSNSPSSISADSPCNAVPSSNTTLTTETSPVLTSLANSVPNDCERNPSGTIQDTDTWSMFRCPKFTDRTTREEVDQILTDPTTEIVPVVSSDGHAALALTRPTLVTPVWICAPAAFGQVHSLHLSPNGHVIWCLRQSRKGDFSVDVCLEQNGVRALVGCWFSDQPGKWEREVLIRVTSLDLLNNFAAFTTTSGITKVQLGLSNNRPCCQSYSWPCPGYHVFQVAATSTGMLLALAVAQPAADAVQPRTREFCLLTTSLSPEQLNASPNVMPNWLKPSRWHPLHLPASVQTHLLLAVQSISSLESLTPLVNSSFQLHFSPQCGSNSRFMGWLFGFLGDTSGSRACGYFLPNLRAAYKPDDLNWFQVSLDVLQPSPSASNLADYSQKRSATGRIAVTFGSPIPCYVASYARSNQSSHFTTELCIERPWFVVRRPSSNVTLLACPRNLLSAFQWSPIELPPQGTASVANLGSIWKHPVLIRDNDAHEASLSSNPVACLLMTNVQSSELFLYTGTGVSRSLPLPSDLGKSVHLSALCVIHRGSAYNLLIATGDGRLFSLLNFCLNSTNEPAWIVEQIPASWNETKASMNEPGFFTSIACAGEQLWATDNVGNLFTAELVDADPPSDGRLISRWLPFSDEMHSRILFLSVSASVHNTCVWALGLPYSSANKRTLMRSLSEGQTMPGSVFVRYNSKKSSDVCWSFVISPPAKRLYVSGTRVWLLSTDSVVYIRPAGFSLDNENQSLVGHWQSLPHPDPISNVLELESLAPGFDAPVYLNNQLVDAIALSTNGKLFALSFHGEPIRIVPSDNPSVLKVEPLTVLP